MFAADPDFMYIDILFPFAKLPPKTKSSVFSFSKSNLLSSKLSTFSNLSSGSYNALVKLKLLTEIFVYCVVVVFAFKETLFSEKETRLELYMYSEEFENVQFLYPDASPAIKNPVNWKPISAITTAKTRTKITKSAF